MTKQKQIEQLEAKIKLLIEFIKQQLGMPCKITAQEMINVMQDLKSDLPGIDPEQAAKNIKELYGLSENEKCWLCGLSYPDTTINVECDVPNGKPTEPHDVKVHHACYMDIEP